MGIIVEPVAEQTEWINSIVTVAKPDVSIRLCLDPVYFNKIIRGTATSIDEVYVMQNVMIQSISFIDAESEHWMVKWNFISELPFDNLEVLL